jgi:hypothetical protein
MQRSLQRSVQATEMWPERRPPNAASLFEHNSLRKIWIWMDTVLKGLSRQETRKLEKIENSFVQPLGH